MSVMKAYGREKKELNNIGIPLNFIPLEVIVSLRNISATFVSK